jgi:hypothetical protein
MIVSTLVVVAGLLGAHSLTRVDQELRVIYAEYTLAATNLGHIYGELNRYRTSVIRALEADTREEFERIATSLPRKQARIDAEIDHFVRSTQSALSGIGSPARELNELNVSASLGRYMDSSRQIIRLLEQGWRTSSFIEAQRLRHKAEQHTATDAGDKYIALTRGLDQLVDVVVQTAGDLQKDADRHLRVATALTVGVSVGLAALVLVL